MDKIKKIEYTYWEEKSGNLLGYLNEFPDQWTQGKDLQELEEYLKDLQFLLQSSGQFKNRKKGYFALIEA